MVGCYRGNAISRHRRKTNGFVVNRGFDGHAVPGWGMRTKYPRWHAFRQPMKACEGPILGGLGIDSVEGDWHHHVDELAICFQDSRLLGSLQAQSDFG